MMSLIRPIVSGILSTFSLDFHFPDVESYRTWRENLVNRVPRSAPFVFGVKSMIKYRISIGDRGRITRVTTVPRRESANEL